MSSRRAEVVDGVVVNVIEVDPQAVPDWAADWPDAGLAGVGWLWDGQGFAAPAPAAPVVPQVVSRLQARMGLIIYGKTINRPNLLAEVDALVAGLSAGDVIGAYTVTDLDAALIKEAWANANEVRRNSRALNLLFPALGLTLPEQLDALFIIAAGLEV